MTGMATTMAGNIVRISQESAGRFTRLVSRATKTGLLLCRAANHGLRIPNEIEHAKENQRDQQDINDTRPVKALKDERRLVKNSVTAMV